MHVARHVRRVSYLLWGVVLAGGLWGAPVAAAATYYVATTGSDAHPGTEAQPFRTVTKGVRGLKPGDTLYVKGGTYAEALINTIPGGTSWSAPVTVAAAPGHTVTLKPPSGSQRVLHFQGAAKRYIRVEGLILDAAHVTYDAVKITSSGGSAAHHIRLRNCEIRNAPANGVLVSPGADANEFINLKVHNNGLGGTGHGLYISGSHNVLEGSAVYNNKKGGVQVWYDHGGVHHNIVRNNRIYNNAAFGLVLASGEQNTAYNNLIWGNRDGLKVMHGGGGGNHRVYHNTVVANRGYGIVVTSAQNTQVVNNITYGNGSKAAFDLGLLGGSGTVLSNNLVSQDPRFVNAAAQDFRLQAGSPAVNRGKTLSLVATDYAGVPRPQGSASNIGGYEYRTTTTSSTVVQPTNLRITQTN